MFLSVDDAHFVPKNFVAYEFYGEKTCFCWCDDKLAIFLYESINDERVQILTAPARIKQIQCYAGRIFLVCSPRGIYKLSREREFAVLSTSAIGIGTAFYEVLVERDGYLYLDDKRKRTNKMLFELQSKGAELNELQIFPLNAGNSHAQLIEAMIDSGQGNESLCVIADKNKLFKLVNDSVQIIYNSMYPVRGIIPIQSDSKINGLLFLTTTDTAVIMHPKENRLIFEKVCLATNIQAICASFSQEMTNAVWIVYSNEYKLYYAKKCLSSDNVRRMRAQDKSFTCLQCYDPKIILGLTTERQFLQLSTEMVEKTLSIEDDTFVNLRADMLKGAEVIMDRIYAGIQRLQTLNETLTNEQNKLRNINLYAHRQRLRTCPNISLHKIAGQTYLSANLRVSLPKNSRLVLFAECTNKMIFCAKTTTDFETAVDLHIPEYDITKSLTFGMDLVVLAGEGTPWCLIKNYVVDPPHDKNRKKRSRVDKSSSINAKISILRNFISEGKTDMKKLSDIKRNIRKEFSEI